MPTAMVTGPSSGIGMATALALGHRGFHVIAAGRSPARIEPVVDLVNASAGSAELVEIDLASLASVRQAARRVLTGGDSLDVLVNNAGVGLGRGITTDGFELHFGVNHLGHYLLTRLLEPLLGPGSRVIQVASAAHFNADGIDFSKMTRPTRSMLGWREYGVSKLANVLFVRELARRHPELRGYAVHPGLVDTGLIPRWIRPLVRDRLLTPEQGAETVLWCATSEAVAMESGLYYRNMEAKLPSPTARDDTLAAELWDRSQRWSTAAALD